MTSPDPAFNIGAEFAKSLYADAKLVTNEVQPYYLLHKDTVRTFLHEKVSLLSSKGQVVAFGGIEISIVAALLTANFQDWHGIKSATIEAAFFLSSLAFGILTLVAAVKWFSTRTSASVDALTDELAKRCVVITSTKGVATQPATDPAKQG